MTIQKAYRLGKELVDKLKEASKREGRTQTWYVVTALNEYFSKGETPKKTKAVFNHSMFDEFWAAYPKKRSKGQAEKTWMKLKPEQPLFDFILIKLDKFKTSNEWLKDGGQFIPNASTWLNNKGWDDELTYGGISNGQNQLISTASIRTKDRTIEQQLTDKTWAN